MGGSTGTFGIICSDNSGNSIAVIANIGDSRAYRYRPGDREPLIQITTDDGCLEYSFKNLNDQAQFNQIKEEIDNASSEDDLSEKGKMFFGMRNQISNYFGHKNEKDYQPNIFSAVLKKGDTLLLITDGISDNLTRDEIISCLSRKEKASEIVEALVYRAVNRSLDTEHVKAKRDDVSVMTFIRKE